MSIDTTNITKEEKEALMKYIGGGLYLNFNKKLRQHKPLNDIELKVYKNLYSLIDKNRISEDMIVYRGIDTTEKEFKKSIGFNPSFTSVSKHKPFTPGKECCHLIIHLKKGSCAMDISRFNKQESEVLIAPGIFTVIDSYKKDYIKKIPKVDFSGGSMKVSYEEKIMPTIYYELIYSDVDKSMLRLHIEREEKDNEEENKENELRFRRKSIRKSPKTKRGVSRKSPKTERGVSRKSPKQ